MDLFEIKTAEDWCAQFKSEVKLDMADETVIRFIGDFLYREGFENAETIRHLFRAGYCYHFANILQTTFNRGYIAYAFYNGHIVWVDGNYGEQDATAYDIEGICKSYTYLIPIDKLGSGILDFKKIPDKQSNLSDDEILAMLKTLVPEDIFQQEMCLSGINTNSAYGNGKFHMPCMHH